MIKISNESEIIHKCQQGDIKSFEIIYDHYKEPLYRVAFRMTGSTEKAEDVLQMTFLNFYKAIKSFRQESALYTFLFSILIHCCYDFKKKNNKKSNVNIDQTDLFYQPQNDLQIQLEQAIFHLPAKMRECFILFAVEGFKQHEISEILNISPGTVKAHIFQAKEKLKKELL